MDTVADTLLGLNNNSATQFRPAFLARQFNCGLRNEFIILLKVSIRPVAFLWRYRVFPVIGSDLSDLTFYIQLSKAHSSLATKILL